MDRILNSDGVVWGAWVDIFLWLPRPFRINGKTKWFWLRQAQRRGGIDRIFNEVKEYRIYLDK